MMNELNKRTEQSDLASASSSGIARRRMILASLGKGASVAAVVAVPMNSLAAIGTLSVTATGERCTVSGAIISGVVHSKETVTAECAGLNPSYSANPANWPTNLSFTTTTTFSELFGSGSSDKLLDILQGALGTSTAEASWITAVLNGSDNSLAVSTNYPYTAAQVISFYQAGDPTRSSALAFFQGFMQTRTI